MRTERSSRAGVPHLVGWRSVNGFARAEELAGRPLQLQPFDLVISNVLLTAAAGPLSPSVGTFTVEAPSDSDFYGLAASIHGFDNSDPTTNSGLGNHASPLDPNPWFAKVLVRENSGGFRYMNDHVRAGHFFGSGQEPQYFPAPMILHPGTTLNFDFSQRDVTTEQMFIAIHGFKRFLSGPPIPVDVFTDPRFTDLIREYRSAGRLRRIDPFWVGMNNEISSDPGLQSEQMRYTNASGDLAISDLMFGLQDPNAEGFGNDLTEIVVRLTINEGQKRIDDRPVHLKAMFGSGRRPLHLAKPLLLRAGQTLNIARTELGPRSTLSTTQFGNWHAFLTFGGVQINRGKP